jgi:hypothetical protein
MTTKILEDHKLNLENFLSDLSNDKIDIDSADRFGLLNEFIERGKEK